MGMGIYVIKDTVNRKCYFRGGDCDIDITGTIIEWPLLEKDQAVV